MAEQQQVDVPVVTNLSIGQGPNGQHWAIIAFSCGPTSFQLAMSPTAFDQFTKGIPAELVKLNDALRRANLGITTALTIPKGMNNGKH